MSVIMFSSVCAMYHSPFFFVLKYVFHALKCIQTFGDSKLSSPERVFLCFALDGTVHMAVKNLLNTGTGSKHTNIIYDQLLTLCFEFRLHPIILALLPWEQVKKRSAQIQTV